MYLSSECNNQGHLDIVPASKILSTYHSVHCGIQMQLLLAIVQTSFDTS